MKMLVLSWWNVIKTDRGQSKSGCCTIQKHGWLYITMGHRKEKGRASVEQVDW